MEVLQADGSNSSEAMKDDKMVKVNGDMNGSVEPMEEDEDGASDESVCGSSRVNDIEDPSSRFGSEIDAKSTSQVESEGEGEAKSNSHFESEGEGKNNFESDEGEGKTRSQFGSEYGAKSETQLEGMDVDGDEEGESVNSEDEENLLNSDNDEPRDESRNQEENQAEMEDTEEEGDINEGPDADLHDDQKDSDDDAEPKSGELPDESSDKKDETPPEERNGNAGQGTPAKKKKAADLNLTPRRSSRTVQKPIRFGQETVGSDEEELEGESDGIEEVGPSDPLADPLIDKENRRFPRMIGNTTIVVSDAKRLADIAAARSQAQQPKKEPTLVIIDTNSILAGRGAMPMQTHGGVTITQQPAPAKYASQPAQPPKPKPPQILPTLTDDMYVVEAPSFIVPYVYEKPPVKKFKKYLKKMLKEVRKQEDERRKKEEEEDEEEKKAEEIKKEESNDAKSEIKDEKDTVKSEVEDEKEVEKMDTSPVSTEKDVKQEKEEEPSEAKKFEEKVESTKKEEEVEKKSPKSKDEASKPDVDSGSDGESSEEEDKKKTPGTGSYFDNPLGKFFMQIGMNLVQEFVQTDLLKQQKKKQKAGKGTEETQAAIASLKKNLILSKENNEPYTMEQTKCEFCSFKTESKLIMAHHLETPHMRNYVYRCNFCPLEVRGPHDILYHMEAEHVVRGRLERAPAFHQCPQCPFEDNQKGKLTRHSLTCGKKFRPEKNLDPPTDWEPPAKIPRLPRKTNSMPMGVNNPLYSQTLGKTLPPHLMQKVPGGMAGGGSPMLRPQRGRPAYPQMPQHQQHKMLAARNPLPPQLTRANLMYSQRPSASSVILPSAYQISNNQLYQVVGAQGQMMNLPGGPPSLQRLPSQQKNPTTVKLLSQPSISITPLPRGGPANPQPGIPPARPGAAGGASAASNSKTTFVICEICDGYIKDLEQLRNHMQWIHKVKIHPKMIYNRPPLNCQKCQFRFFTDQGLERHLLGSHGLVTSSMQDQANRGKDGGRCPVCGRVYQWKLLNHVARDHNMTLKPAHLSYKCTVCTATFGMYKQFESHVYSAHSVVAKRVMDKKNGPVPSTSRNDTATLLKPLKINDEITIIPQPAKKPAQQRPVPGNYRVSWSTSNHSSSSSSSAAPMATPAKARGPDSVQVIDLEDSPNKTGENGSESLTAVKERLRRRQSLEIRQVESEQDETESDGEGEPEPEAESNNQQPDADQDDDDAPTEGESDG